jgi:hypothetical protein
MDIDERRSQGGWINAFAISLTIWLGAIAAISLL